MVVIAEEETMSANALKLIMNLQVKQEQMAGMPQYEIDLYRKKGSKRQMDMINFAYEHFVLCDGLWLPDMPL